MLMSDVNGDAQQKTGTRRHVQGTGTWMDGSLYYGPEEFEAEHGCTFAEWCDRLEHTEPEPEQEGRLYRDARTLHD